MATAQTGRVLGVVRDDRGEPIKGATVVAENPDATPRSFASTTDDKGRFGILGLKSGSWNMTAQAPGHVGQAGVVNVRQGSGANPPITFTLQNIPTVVSALGAVAMTDLQADLAIADQLYNSQAWDAAIAAYRSVLNKTPALSFINLQIAAASRSKGDFNAAVAAYNALLTIEPNNDKAMVGIAMVSLDKGDIQAAEQTLEAAAQGSGATREVFYRLAEVKLSKNNVEDATKAYLRAAAVDPTWGKPVLALGRVAMNRGDKAAATKYFERVLEIDPVSPEATQAKTALEQVRK